MRACAHSGAAQGLPAPRGVGLRRAGMGSGVQHRGPARPALARPSRGALRAPFRPGGRERPVGCCCVATASCRSLSGVFTRSTRGRRALFDRFQRSWDLAVECMSLLMEDKSLLIFPLLSSLAMLVIIGSFAVPLFPSFALWSSHGAHAMPALTYVALFAFYWLQYSIVIFFNTGLILRVIAERVGIIGRIVVSLIGLAWSVATALVAPVLAAEDVGPIEAIERSVELIKKAWGEDIIGSAGIGF